MVSQFSLSTQSLVTLMFPGSFKKLNSFLCPPWNLPCSATYSLLAHSCNLCGARLFPAGTCLAAGHETLHCQPSLWAPGAIHSTWEHRNRLCYLSYLGPESIHWHSVLPQSCPKSLLLTLELFFRSSQIMLSLANGPWLSCRDSGIYKWKQKWEPFWLTRLANMYLLYDPQWQGCERMGTLILRWREYRLI